MQKISLLIFSLVAVWLSTACSDEAKYSSSSEAMEESTYEMMEVEADATDISSAGYSPVPAPPARLVDHQAEMERQIIRTARVSMQVSHMDSAKHNIDNLIRQFNAYVTTDNRNNQQYRLSLEMTIRVQQDQLDQLLQGLLKQAVYVHHNNITAEDVTEEFVDLNIRLKNKRAVEEQYVKLLNKAGKIEDILKIENELRKIREEIEAKEGRLKYLKSQVSMSTIHLTAYQDIYLVSKAPAKGFWLKIADGFSGGWDLLKSLIIGLAYIWPVIIVVVAATWYFKERYRRYKMRKSTSD